MPHLPTPEDEEMFLGAMHESLSRFNFYFIVFLLKSVIFRVVYYLLKKLNSHHFSFLNYIFVITVLFYLL